LSGLRRIVMIRHGETVGNSRERLHGAGDVALSETGRAHMRAAARDLGHEVFDSVVASPLRRSWQSAAIVAGGAPLADGAPELGGSVSLTRDGDGRWFPGLRSSDPPALSREALA
jgi:broad specificity phosphatase PhoE